MNNRKKVLLFQFVSLLIVSLISGALIALMHVALKYTFDAAMGIYENSIQDRTPLIIYFSVGSITVFAFYLFIRLFKLSIGSSVDTLKRYLSDEKVKIYEYPLLILGFFISFFTGLPVGSVEISQCLAVGIGREVYDRFKVKDEDSFDYLASSSFAATFMSPLAGLAYAFESRKWKVNVLFIVKVIVSIVFSVGSCYLIKMAFHLENDYLFRLAPIDSFSWKSLWLYAFMGAIIAISAFVINLSTFKLRDIFAHNKKLQNITTIFTFVILLAAVICTYFGFRYQWYTFSLAGFDGRRIVMLYDRFKSIELLIGTLFLWVVFILLLPHSNIIGGKILPLLALGALIGIVFSFNGKDNGLMKSDENLMMMSVAMFSLYGVTYKKPATAFILALTFSCWSIIPYQLLPLILCIAPGYVLMLLTKLPSWNECQGLPDTYSRFLE